MHLDARPLLQLAGECGQAVGPPRGQDQRHRLLGERPGEIGAQPGRCAGDQYGVGHGRLLSAAGRYPFSQPPVNPARCNPRRRCGFRRIVFQISPVR